MHDLMMLIMGSGGGVFPHAPTNPAQISPKSLIRVSVHSFGKKKKRLGSKLHKTVDSAFGTPKWV